MSKAKPMWSDEFTIYRHGKPIKVSRLIMDLPPPRWERQKKLFIKMTVEDVVAGCKALRCPMALVWYALHFRMWAEKSDTVRVPTALLRSWGVNRWNWMRALGRLERAGLIQTQHERGRSIVCRLVQVARVRS